MRTIVLYGHQAAAQDAFVQIDAMLRERDESEVVLVQTTAMDQLTARSLRTAGSELWFCGPSLQQPDGGWCPVAADRYLVGRSYEDRTAKAIAACLDFLNGKRAVQ